MTNTIRSLRATLENASVDVSGQSSIELVIAVGLHTWKIGRLTNLAVENDKLVGDLEFADTPYGKTAKEMFQTSEQEPRLSSGCFGAFLQII